MSADVDEYVRLAEQILDAGSHGAAEFPEAYNAAKRLWAGMSADDRALVWRRIFSWSEETETP